MPLYTFLRKLWLETEPIRWELRALGKQSKHLPLPHMPSPLYSLDSLSLSRSGWP